MRIFPLSPKWFIRMFKWRGKINQLLESIATKEDATGWCLYSCSHDEKLGYFIETMIYWYSNARFELVRNSSDSKVEEKLEIEIDSRQPASSVKSSGIVAEEGYLIRRILIYLDPTDFIVSYHPQPDEEDDIDDLGESESSEYLLDDDDDEQDDEIQGGV